MPFLHFYSSSRSSIPTTHPRLTLLRVKWPLNYIKIFALFCLPLNAALVNTALAGEIYSTGFESGSLTPKNGFKWGSGTSTAVSTNMPKTGSYSLKFTFSGGPDGTDAFSEQRFTLGGFYPELWIKYDLYIPSNYYHRDSSGSDNNKGLIKLWAGTYSSDNREGPLFGPSFWLNGDGTSKSIAYASARINGVKQLGNHFWDGPSGKYYDPGKKSQAITNNDKGRWMTIVIHVKYASKANNDGVAEIWKTDWQGKTTKLHDIHNGPWYGTQPNSTVPARGFDKGYLLGWANSGFDKDTVLYIDDIIFSTTPLVNNYIASPKPPTMLNQ